MGSLRDREVACSASDRQGSNFESCVWVTVSSQSYHHPQEVVLAQFSVYVHKGGLKPDSFHFTHHVLPDLSRFFWITILLYKCKRQYLLTCKVSKYCTLALHGSRHIIATNVGLMMYMSGDSISIAWMKKRGWTGFPYVKTDSIL